ncbi:MAG TPA: hypothetical protein VNS63_16935, partial [Blastocatellia bacterium]|nr:hypothetical protein [Blastocatellia bacterium]
DQQTAFALEQSSIADQQRQRAEDGLKQVELLRQVALAAQDAKEARPGQAQGPVLFAIEAARRTSDPSLETDQVLRQGLASFPRLLPEPEPRGKAVPHGKRVADVAFTTTGRYFVTASGDGIVRMAESNTGEQVWQGRHDSGEVNAVSVSATGRYVATAGSDSTARVWEIVGGKEVKTLHHGGPVRSVAFSPDGRRLATGSSDGTARLWDTSDWRETATMPHGGEVLVVSFSPDGRYVATACSDGKARLWETGANKPTAEMPHGGSIQAVAFSADSRYVATAGTDKMVRLWLVTTGSKVYEVPHQAASIALSRDGRYLATGGSDGTVRVWPVSLQSSNTSTGASEKGDPSGRGDPSSNRPVMRRLELKHSGDITAMAFNPDGRYLATASLDGTARIWDVTTGRQLGLMEPGGPVTALAFRPPPDWGYLVTATANGKAQVWQLLSGADIARVGPQGNAVAVAFGETRNDPQTPPSLLMASRARQTRDPAGFLPNGFVQVWELDGKAKGSPILLDRSVNGMALSMGFVATANNDKTARVFDLKNGREVTRFAHDNAVWAVALTADGRYLATTSSDGIVRVWDAKSGSSLGDIDNEHRMSSVALSPDGLLVAAASETAVRIWDRRTRREVTRLDQVKWAIALAFSPDGRYLATSSSGENMVRFWELKKRREVGRIDHPGPVTALAFDQTKGFVATAGIDGTAHVWLWRPAEIVEDLCRRLTRNMTGEEWLKYMGDQPYSKTCDNLGADPRLFEVGESLAAGGDVKRATMLLRAAIRLRSEGLETDPVFIGPEFKGNPEEHAHMIEAVAKVDLLATSGRIQQAAEAYARAEKFSQGKGVDAYWWNQICWYGGLWNRPADAIAACEKAVKLAPEPNRGAFADSRGLVRALLAFREGAIDSEKLIKAAITDFEKYVNSKLISEDSRARRRKWIAELRDGRNPFTAEELRSLRER